ncbi:alpha/beta hydrolase [Methylocaldum sp.]|uniref:alpha/beta hydrolase n=1 Tax=Methylocaldum sp. TaxID=1969727 RepID=UPI002D38FC97|nr:alpha/beta hydrolase [Methylocaldum sp.]HYE35536.1 alpha/beta hydrolase [Methylocaldum sp.]
MPYRRKSPIFQRRGILAALLLCVCQIASATRVDEASYHYPYKNPYLATATVAILKDREERYVWDDTRYLDIELIPSRNDVYLLEGKGKLRVRYSPQPGPAPLIFLLPGFGGSAYSGAARYVAQLLTDHGFQVLSLPSPFHWNFTLAASGSALPGLTERDSEDLYRAMQSALNMVRERFHPEITRIGLIGLSHGALSAAYLSKLDSERKKIGFDTTLLVNPPIDLPGAIHTIDRLADLEQRYTAKERSDIQAYAVGVGSWALSRDIEDADYFAHWDERLRLGDSEIRYLIGWTLRQPVGSSLYVSALVHPRMGILQTPITWGYRSVRLEEARSFDLLDYLERVLVPQLEPTSGRKLSFDQLVRESSLTSIASALRDNPKVYLMHNADDFLVSGEDLKFAERIFGGRATIYPCGGHLGNLWYTQNRQDILAILKPLLTDLSMARQTGERDDRISHAMGGSDD